MTTQLMPLTAATGWQVWHLAALAVGFVGLILLVRQLRRKGPQNSKTMFLARFPDAAKLYVELRGDDRTPRFKITRVNQIRPCRFSDSTGRGLFVPAGGSAIVIDGQRPVTLEFEAAPYGTYRLDKDKNEKPIVVEMKSL